MDTDDAVKIITSFKWDTLQSMYGCAHNSIIGFLSTMWINLENDNSVLDGAPSPIIGSGRTGQRNADILFCKGDEPLIIVEVETVVDKYPKKLESILQYLHSSDYKGLQFGILIMTNLCSNNENKKRKKYKHNWDEIKSMVQGKKDNIALISIEKQKILQLGESILGKLKRRNEYSSWQIINIDYWVYGATGIIREGNLWCKT